MTGRGSTTWRLIQVFIRSGPIINFSAFPKIINARVLSLHLSLVTFLFYSLAPCLGHLITTARCISLFVGKQIYLSALFAAGTHKAYYVQYVHLYVQLLSVRRIRPYLVIRERWHRSDSWHFINISSKFTLWWSLLFVTPSCLLLPCNDAISNHFAASAALRKSDVLSGPRVAAIDFPSAYYRVQT